MSDILSISAGRLPLILRVEEGMLRRFGGPVALNDQSWLMLASLAASSAATRAEFVLVDPDLLSGGEQELKSIAWEQVLHLGLRNSRSPTIFKDGKLNKEFVNRLYPQWSTDSQEAQLWLAGQILGMVEQINQSPVQENESSDGHYTKRANQSPDPARTFDSVNEQIRVELSKANRRSLKFKSFLRGLDVSKVEDPVLLTVGSEEVVAATAHGHAVFGRSSLSPLVRPFDTSFETTLIVSGRDLVNLVSSEASGSFANQTSRLSEDATKLAEVLGIHIEPVEADLELVTAPAPAMDPNKIQVQAANNAFWAQIIPAMPLTGRDSDDLGRAARF